MAQNPLVPRYGGNASALNITAAKVVKASPGTLYRFVVTVAGAAGNVYDSVSTSGNSASNLIATIPATVGVYELSWPCAAGIVVAPGAAQVVSVSYA